jgi:hypothetical protein
MSLKIELRSPRGFDVRIAFCHHLLQGDGAVNCVNHATEFGQNTVPSGVDHAAAGPIKGSRIA